MLYRLRSLLLLKIQETANMSDPLETHTNNATLPFETIGHIFSHVENGYPVNLRHLFFVCRSWYHAVRYHPLYGPTFGSTASWATISIFPPSFQARLLRTISVVVLRIVQPLVSM